MKRLKTTLSNPSAHRMQHVASSSNKLPAATSAPQKMTACVEANSRSQAKNQKAAKALLKRCRDWVGSSKSLRARHLVDRI